MLNVFITYVLCVLVHFSVSPLGGCLSAFQMFCTACLWKLSGLLCDQQLRRLGDTGCQKGGGSTTWSHAPFGRDPHLIVASAKLRFNPGSPNGAQLHSVPDILQRLNMMTRHG